MTCSGAYASPNDYASFWCLSLDSAEEEATVNRYLAIAASDIHATLASAGACNCTLADWALEFLKKLNIVDAAIYHRCPCARPHISDDERAGYLEWMNLQLELIRESKVDVCAGATGADWPVTGWAEQAVTEFAAAQIILNRAARGS